MRASPIATKDRLIVALDVPSTDDAKRIIDDLGETINFYKIGHQLLPIGGIELGKELIAAGHKVFFDYKFYDIGNTVKNGVASVASLGAHLLTIHGDRDIIDGAVAGRGASDLKLLAVTVLTSMNQANLEELGYQGTVEDLVLKRAQIAVNNGCDGIVASAQEVTRLRAELGQDFLIVTPGIRSAGVAANDQKRVSTPGDAIRAGSDYLVMGREITNADDKRAAALHVFDQIEAAL